MVNTNNTPAETPYNKALSDYIAGINWDELPAFQYAPVEALEELVSGAFDAGYSFLMAPAEHDGENENFEQDLILLINRHSKEGRTNTPDFILGNFLEKCLQAYTDTIDARNKWHQLHKTPGQTDFPKPTESITLNITNSTAPDLAGSFGIEPARQDYLCHQMNEMCEMFDGHTVRTCDLLQTIADMCYTLEELLFCTIMHFNWHAKQGRLLS